jgi:toxin-antitoxin system PIN domain toxin
MTKPTKAPRYLLDVNVLVAILNEDHVHHQVATQWFDTPGLQWAICPFAEAGLLRHMTRPKIGGMSIEEVTEMLTQLKQQPGYHFQPISADWHALSGPFFKRLFGHNQITDAYLLGLAVQDGLILATFDRAMLHLAGEHHKNVLILDAK